MDELNILFNGEQMDNIEEFIMKEAKARFNLKNKVKSHRNIYFLLIGLLFIINMCISPQYLWLNWITIPWGLLLVYHYFRTLKKIKNSQVYEREIELEIEKSIEQLKKIKQYSNGKDYNAVKKFQNCKL